MWPVEPVADFLMFLDGGILGGGLPPSSSYWVLLTDEGGVWRAAQLPVLTAERLNLGGCR